MRLRTLTSTISNHAPRLLGAFFCAISLLAATSCDKQSDTPDWDTPGTDDSRTAVTTTQPTAQTPPVLVSKVDDEPKSAEVPKSVAPPTETSPPPETASTEGLRFITYNVENWLTMDRYVNYKKIPGAPKPESEKESVVKILVRHMPDVIGLCEIGNAADLAELQDDLKAAGLNLPHSQYTGGSDPTRHLGLLSRFPITSTAKPAVTEYQLAGRTFAINRGIIDVSIEARGKPYRFIGAHLKSKRDVEIADEEAIRLNEARLLRKHVDSIFAENADARLIVYGDMNDTWATPAIKAITGKFKTPTYLNAMRARDSRNEHWTHYWSKHDIYSRIDFIMVSQALRGEIDVSSTKIIDDEDWEQASDHRAVMAIFN